MAVSRFGVAPFHTPTKIEWNVFISAPMSTERIVHVIGDVLLEMLLGQLLQYLTGMRVAHLESLVEILLLLCHVFQAIDHAKVGRVSSRTVEAAEQSGTIYGRVGAYSRDRQ